MRLSVFSSSVLTLALAACGDDGGTTTDTNTPDTTADVADTSDPEVTPDTIGPEDTSDTSGPDIADTNTPGDTAEVCAGPSTCDDGDPCTEDAIVSGSFATCDLVCTNRSIVDDADLPDDDFVDSNCDGVDGDVDALVFVAPDGANAESCGTLAAPCATLGYALELAQKAGKSVAVSVGTYDEHVTLVEGVHLHGGYDRAADWRRGVDQRAIITSSLVQGEEGSFFIEGVLARDLTRETVVEHVTVRTADAPTEAFGASNYGVRVLASPGLVLRDLVVDAGAASAGVPGGDGNSGLNGLDGNSATSRAGAPATEARSCEGAGTVPPAGAGGNGGFDGVTALAGTGSNSQPGPGGGVPACSLGGGGAGRNWDNLPLQDTPGLPGGDGPSCTFNVAPGLGGVASAELGGVDASGHFVQAFGRSGAHGANGLGGAGGGGGGSGDADTIAKGADGGGGGGGSGGGCGGYPGEGGTPGGTSIALLAVDSDGLRVEGSIFGSGAGGAGGPGGAGGAGGLAGTPGNGRAGQATPSAGVIAPRNSLTGGRGGRGSDGAIGGGGAGGGGGHSIGMMLCRSELGLGSDNTMNVASAGAGGQGGYPYGADGSGGLALEVFEGCHVPAALPVQLGYSSEPNTAAQRTVLLAFPGGTAASGWDGEAGTCGEGMVAAGAMDDLAVAGGSWLCVPPAYVNGRFFLQDSALAQALELEGGEVVPSDPVELGLCPFGARIAFVEIGGESDAAWVCYEPSPTAWRWEFRNTAEGWNPTNTTITGASTGLSLNATTADPWITSPPVTIDTASLEAMVVRMKVTAGAIAGVYFMREGEGASEERVVNVAIAASEDFVDVVFDMGSHASWTGVVTQLRFDFSNAPGEAVIQSITMTD